MTKANVEMCKTGGVVSPVTQRRTVTFGYLLHLVVISQRKECLLESTHLLHFGHYIFVDSIHDLLHTDNENIGQIKLQAGVKRDKRYLQ